MLPAFIRHASAALFGAAVAITLSGAAGPAAAQNRQQGTPGEFDFYVLSLSWSPSFCADSADRNPERAANNPQCGGPRPFSFVVHGLWPQYEKGFPENCVVPPPRLNHNIMSGMLDLMPAPRLIYHEWDTHGVCSGLSANAYFDTIRKARELVKIPPRFHNVSTELTVSPKEVEDAFVTANPGMKSEGISVDCGGGRSKRLGEIRICMTRDLQFRDCSKQMEQRSCPREQVIMPLVRGG
jgi:ribonuclease T2